MHKDAYGNPLSTPSQAASDAFNLAMACYFTAQPGAETHFATALEADPGFALAHVGLARAHHVSGDGRAARAKMADAEKHTDGLTTREAQHLAILNTVITGQGPDPLAAARAHLAEFPRDALIASLCLGVFSLIGFSGRPGREAENLAMAAVLAPHYGDDPWFLSYYGFAQMEAGQLAQAERSIEVSLAGNPKDANAAHHRAHLCYEIGDPDAGYAYLSNWMSGYDRAGLMHCHNSWHVALWAMARGDTDAMWQIVDRDLDPDVTLSPPINVMTDLASLLYRAELAGVAVPGARWKQVSAYAAAHFAKPRLAFVDVHSALAHAMAGETELLDRIRNDAKGPASDMVVWLADAFGAIARQDWAVAEAHLTRTLGDQARIGGSRAQRDLIEFAMAQVLMKQGKSDAARLLLATRRPMTQLETAVAA